MSGGLDPMEERVANALKRLQLTHLRETLASVLSEAAKGDWTYLEFLDRILQREVDSKQGKRVRMGLQIAHFPSVLSRRRRRCCRCWPRQSRRGRCRRS